MNDNKLPFHVQAFPSTDKGRRPNNEDFVTFFEPSDPQERKASGCIYIVADGVGGASVGERASKYAAEKVMYEYLKNPEIEPGKRLKQAIAQANRDIFDYAENNGIRMATTMSIAVVFGGSLIAANVGDSRVYLIRGSETRQITEDHSIVGELVRNGEMTESEAMKSKVKNKITRSVGGNDNVRADVFGPISLKPDDKIVLCTDGLTRYAKKDDIAQLTISRSPKQITNDLIGFAKRRGHGGADNISVISVIYEPTTPFEETVQRARPTERELMETITDIKYKRLHQPSLSYWFIALIVILGLISVSGIIKLYLFKDNMPRWFSIIELPPTQNTAYQNPTPIPLLPSITQSSILAVTPAFTQTLLPESTFTSLANPTITLTPSITSVLEPSPTATIVYVNCIYTVVFGDTSSTIAERFGIGGNNYKKMACAPLPNGGCDLTNPSSIVPGWRVIIPNVVDTICTGNGGALQ